MAASHIPWPPYVSPDPNGPRFRIERMRLLRAVLVLTGCALAVLPSCGSRASEPIPDDRVAGAGTTPERSPETCPPDWPGPWTACPEAAWVGQVAERAGFRIVDETGSALVARGSGSSFYIWATEIREPVAEVAEREKWHPLGRRAGVLVYGDRDLWRWWAAQGFVFWMQAGPYEGSEAPDLEGLAPLIRASREVTPP
jgi:hypothetical protein